LGKIRVNEPRLRMIAGRYFWRPTAAVKKLGFANQALGADPVVALNEARRLNNAVREALAGAATPSIVKNSISDVIAKYRASAKFTLKLAPKTRKEYGKILDKIEDEFGRDPVSFVDRVGLVRIYDDLQPRGLSMANATMRVWSIILGFAYNRGLRPDNPALKMGLIAPNSRVRVWSADEMKAFCDAAVKAGRASMSLAVRLAWDLVQREGDILDLTWGDWTGDGFKVTQNKTGKRLSLPIHRALASEMRKLRQAPATHVLISEATGQPYKEDHFRHEFARIRELAGLPADLQFRDLRRTGATDLGAHGATDDQIRSVTGHANRGSVAVYVQADDMMARSAQLKRHGNGADK